MSKKNEFIQEWEVLASVFAVVKVKTNKTASRNTNVFKLLIYDRRSDNKDDDDVYPAGQ